MTTATWLTMVLVVSFVWGGFLWVLFTAIRREAGKSGEG